MNTIKAFLYHLKVEFLTGFRNKSVFFINYFLPLFFYIMMGFVMVKLNEDFVDYMKVSMILFAIMTSTLLSVPNEMVFSRAEGVFRSYKIYGIGKVEIILHYTLNSLLHCVITGLIIYFTAGPLFGAKEINNIPVVLLILTLYFFANMGISLAISMISSIPRVAALVAQAIFIPSILAGGIIIPLDMMPKDLIKIIPILPSTHVMNIYQLESTNIMDSAINFTVRKSLIVLTLFIVITYGLSLIKFKYNNK